jgi:hypothetical protein
LTQRKIDLKSAYLTVFPVMQRQRYRKTDNSSDVSGHSDALVADKHGNNKRAETGTAKTAALHPSWAAKQSKQHTGMISIQPNAASATNKKIVFDED